MWQQLCFGFIFIAICVGCKESRFVDHEMISLQREHEELEQKVFDRLVFTLSKSSLPGTFNYKFIVQDQLDREWMFKTTGLGEIADGEIAIYNLYRMFGVSTPEIHTKTFNVNGTQLSGTLQRLLVPNMGALTEGHMRHLGEQGRTSLAKLHALAWLSANHHVHPRQFLVIGEDNKPRDVIRIDNSVEWFLIGNDELSVAYQTPVLWSNSQIGYARFWRLYLTQDYLVPLEKIAAWSRVIQDFPDDIFSEPFQVGISNDLRNFANNGLNPGSPSYKSFIPEVTAKVDAKTIMPALLERKKSFAKDMAGFYEHLLSLKNKKLKTVSDKDVKDAAKEIKVYHKTSIEKLKHTIRELDAIKNDPQAMIEPEISFTAYRALKPLTSINYMSAAERNKVTEKVIASLEEILRSAAHPHDKKSAEIALANVERLKNKDLAMQRKHPGKTTVWIRQDVMRMNDLLSAEGLRSDKQKKKNKKKAKGHKK